ncbi:hypothetical protein FB451DRAFT_1253064 [Mycena latifolia]|nr:hypothetical protein FB451DRAFT_1318039 [Mycena latifolia]KAJ7471140.1 hypothetical protein FB451DRAFT_1253064 [Mycena latifolia]
MKLIVAIILPFLSAVIANPTGRDTRNCGLPCECRLELTCDGGVSQVEQCAALGYSCPALGTPILAGGGPSNDTCADDCMCTRVCPFE